MLNISDSSVHLHDKNLNRFINEPEGKGIAEEVAPTVQRGACTHEPSHVTSLQNLAIGRKLTSLFWHHIWYLFEFFTNYTKMPIEGFLSLLRENKKHPVTKCYPQWE